MKKLLFLFTTILLISCSSEDDDKKNALIIDGQEYPIIEGGIGFFNDEEGRTVGIALGQESFEEYLAFEETPYNGHFIDIYYQTDSVDGVGDFSNAYGEYNLTYNSEIEPEGDELEAWVDFGHFDGSTPETTLSVTKSDNSYMVDLKTSDENGNDVELYYNGNLLVLPEEYAPTPIDED